MFRLMIAEDNIHLMNYYQNILSEDKNVNVVAKTFNGEETIKLYKEKKPDILLLDLDLPIFNGLEVINKLSKFEVDKKSCNIIIISGNYDLRLELFNTEKVYRIIAKPASKDCIINTIHNFISENSRNEFPIDRLRNLMFALKLKPYSNSCNLLIDTIETAYYSPYLLDNMKTLYNITASRYDYSSEKVKESIRSCIRTINRFADTRIFEFNLFYS